MFIKTLVIAVLLILLPLVSHAEESQKIKDSRFISKILLPKTTHCGMDISNDGKTLYLLCPGKERFQNLQFYDISNLSNPTVISSGDLPNISGAEIIVRNDMAFFIDGDGFNPVDISNPKQPIVFDHYATGPMDGIRVSDSGQQIVTRKLDHLSGAYTKTFIDVSDHAHPKEMHPAAEPEWLQTPGKWSAYESAKEIKGIPPNFELKDARNGKVLVVSSRPPQEIQYYDVPSHGEPKVLSKIPEPGQALYVHLIPGKDAVAFHDREGQQEFIEIASLAKAEFDLHRLYQVYQSISSKASECPERKASPECLNFKWNSLAQLSDAGIEDLLNDAHDVPNARRALMLNDYAFWLYLWRQKDIQNLQNISNILKKVVELSPDRSVAWLNFGDAQRDMIPIAATDTEKADLWQKAQSYYAHYKEHSGKDVPQPSELASFNIPQVLKGSNNVCDYIAAAENNNSLDHITSPQGTATINGTVVNFVVGWVSNSGEVAIKEAGNEDATSEAGEKINLLKLASVPQKGEFPVGPIYIIPFKGTYYTYSIGNVVDPIAGPVCSVASEKPQLKLVENKESSLCEKYSSGLLKHNAQWTPIDSASIKKADVGIEPTPAFFNHETNIAFAPADKKRRVGHFEMHYSAKMGCDHYGVALLDKDNMPEGEPNKSLLEYQHKWWSCDSADADLIQADDKTYVDAWEGGASIPQRVLLQFSGDKFEPVCRIKPEKTYKSGPVLGAQAPSAEVTATESGLGGRHGRKHRKIMPAIESN